MEEPNQINSQDQDFHGILCQHLSSSTYTIPKNANSIKVRLYLMKLDFVNSMAEYSSNLNTKYTNYITNLNALSEAGNSPDLIAKFIKIQEILQSSIKNNLNLMSDFFDQAIIKNAKPDELMYNIKKNIKEPNIQNEVYEFVKARNDVETKLNSIPIQNEKEGNKNVIISNIHPKINVNPNSNPVGAHIEVPASNLVSVPVEVKDNASQIDKAAIIPKEELIQDQIKPNEEIEEYNNPSGDLIKIQITKPDDVSNKNSELNINAGNVRKLKASNLSCENINALFKIKYLLKEMTSCTIKRSSLDNPNLRKFMPNLRYLKLSTIGTHLSSYNLFISFPKLKELYLNSVNLRNKSFKAIMSSLLNQTNEEMASNLEVISFKNNKINNVALLFPKGKFNKLKILDFENNKLHTFNLDSFVSLPSIEYINLSSNDFLYNNTFEELTKIANEENSKVSIMIGSNPFLLKDNSKAKYIEYLTKTLSPKEITYSLPSLTFCYLFNKNNKSTLVNHFVGYNIWNKLNELNLAFCQLKNEDLMKIFQYESNTFACLNKLNIASNEIDDDIFKLFNENAPEKLKKLKILDLSHTLIKGNNKNMVPFLKNTRKIKRMKIYSTPFEDSFFLFLRGLVETMKKQDPKEKPLILKSEIEIALNEYNTLFSTFDQIGTIHMKICLQVTSTTLCRKLQKNPPECAKYFEIKE